MHPEFSDWFRSAGISPPEGLLQKRWDAVSALADTDKPAVLLSLLRLYILPSAKDDTCDPAIREVFRKHDDTFPSAGNVPELRVLAGAVLRCMLESRTRFAMTATLGILAGAFPSRVRQMSSQSHVGAAERYNVINGVERRQRSALPKYTATSAISKERFDELFKPAIDTNTVAGLSEPLRNLLTEILTMVDKSLADAYKSVTIVGNALCSKEEEVDYLWWLTTSHSRSLNIPFKELGVAQACLVLPHELAELTKLLPGPASATPILLQALLASGASTTAESMTIAEAVNSTQREWREQVRVPQLDRVTTLCPVSWAICKSLDTDGPNDWLPVYRKGCEVAPELGIHVGVLALQAYRERLFLRAMEECG